MAKLSALVLLALFAAPLNVIAQSSGATAVPAVLHTGTAANDVPAQTGGSSSNAGGAAAGGSDNGGSSNSASGSGASGSETGSPSPTGSGTGAAASGSANATSSVSTIITSNQVDIITNTSVVPAQTITANGSVETIPATTITTEHATTHPVTLTTEVAASSTHSKGFGNHNADIGLAAGWISGLVLFLAAGL